MIFFLIRLDPPSTEKTPSPGDQRLSTYSLLLIRQTDHMGAIPYRSGNVGLTHFLMKHPVRSGNQKKKTHFVGFFFLCAFGVLRLRRPPSQLDRPCASPDVPLTTGSTLRLSTYSFTRHDMDDRLFLYAERWVNPLPDEASRTKYQKRKTRYAGLFFLTGLRPVLPLGQCPPSKP